MALKKRLQQLEELNSTGQQPRQQLGQQLEQHWCELVKEGKHKAKMTSASMTSASMTWASMTSASHERQR